MTVQLPFQTIRSIIVANLLNGSLQQFIQFMDEIIEESDPTALQELNRVISKPELLSLLIQLIRNHPDFFKKMQRESYYHENGFHKIVLLSGRNFKVRLHHFGASAKIPMENIHDHRWPFASSILYGSLKMDLFEVSECNDHAEKLYHFVYNSDKQSGSYSTNLKGMTCVQKVETRSFGAGDHYLMLPHELHRIKNQPGEESITLILTGKPQSRLCNLYAKREILEKEKATIPYSSETLCSMLDQILEVVYPHKN